MAKTALVFVFYLDILEANSCELYLSSDRRIEIGTRYENILCRIEYLYNDYYRVQSILLNT